MDRRGFLQAILAAGVAPAVVRIGSLMPVRGIIIPTFEEIGAFVGFNGLLTPAMIAKEALVLLENNLVMANRINRKFDDQF